jgi:hypothetical protein
LALNSHNSPTPLGHFILIRDQPVLSYVHLFVLQCLRISNSVKQQYTTGEIVSLVSVECQRIQDAFAFSQELLSFFLIMIFGLYELWNPMGYDHENDGPLNILKIQYNDYFSYITF